MKTRYHPMPTEDDEQDPTAPRLRRRGDDAEYVLGEETLVGRGLECDILISDSDSISRRHAQVFRDAEGLFVADLGSTNGTHLNGTEVTERTALADGDVLAFDEYEFDVVIPPPPPPPPADPEATRLVSRDETLTRADRLALEALAEAEDARLDAAAEPASEPMPEPTSEPIDDDDGDAAWPARGVVDEMGDDRSWPEIEDDAREPILGFADERGPDEAARDDSAPLDVSPADLTPDDVSPIDVSPVDVSPVEIPAPESTSPGRSDVDPIDRAPAELASSAPPAPERETPIESRAPAEAPPGAPSAERPESAHPDVAPREPAPREAAPGESAPRDAAPRDANPRAAAAPREASRPDAAPAPSDAAAVPGAWANAADVQGAAGHTMIVKYVAPRRQAPPPIDPESLDGPALVVGTDDPAGEVLPLDAGVTEWIVGSGDDCDLFIDDDGVSKRHAVLSREGNKWRLCDELSANGTYVNGNRLNIGYVGDGDALRFGSVECRLVIPKGGRAKKPARGKKAPVPPAKRAAAGGQDARAPFPWKPVVLTLAVVLVLALVAAAAFVFLTGR